MKRTHLNFAIDAAAFGAFLLLLSTGLLLRYQLPAGSGGMHAVGSGRGAVDRPITLLWGWTRHEWGQVHYWIAGLLIAILALHLVLHWKWIVCVIRGSHGDASGLRFGLGLASLSALVLVAAAPLLAPVQSVTRGELEEQRESASFDEIAELRGSMTLAEVEKATKMPVDDVLRALELPSNVPPDERIGRLLRQHGLQMSDLRRVLKSVYGARKETEP